MEHTTRTPKKKKGSGSKASSFSLFLFTQRVGFVKINADCTLVDGTTHHEHRLPGICFLRGSSVAILVALICEEEEEEEGENGEVYSLLVEQPR